MPQLAVSFASCSGFTGGGSARRRADMNRSPPAGRGCQRAEVWPVMTEDGLGHGLSLAFAFRDAGEDVEPFLELLHEGLLHNDWMDEQLL